MIAAALLATARGRDCLDGLLQLSDRALTVVHRHSRELLAVSLRVVGEGWT